MKKTWLLLRKAIGKQSNRLYFLTTFNIDNEQVSNKMKTAESFNNNYFSSIGKTTSQNIPRENTNYTNYFDKPVINSMIMEKVDYL